MESNIELPSNIMHSELGEPSGLLVSLAVENESGSREELKILIMRDEEEEQEMYLGSDLLADDYCLYTPETTPPRAKLSLINKPFQCIACKEQFWKKTELMFHMHHNRARYDHQFQCDICGSYFPLKHSLLIHIRAHKKQLARLRCQHCSRSFDRPVFLQNHIRAKHSNLTGRGPPEKPYPCALCSKRYYTTCQLNEHIKLVHEKTPAGSCTECGKEFVTLARLAVHMKLHNADKGLPCDQCTKTFVNRFALAKHRDSVHAVERKFKCGVCAHTFKSEVDLKCHSAFHTKPPKFVCQFCGQKYHREIEWREHTYIHTGQRPYSCNYCEKDFTRRQQLREHTRLHEGQAYNCTQCNKSFINRNKLQQHLQVHGLVEKTHACTICGKSFYRKFDVNRHIKVVH